MIFLAVYVSGDGRRTQTDELEAVDIDAAATLAIDQTSWRFGAGASWYVAGVVQLDRVAEVAATLEVAAGA